MKLKDKLSKLSEILSGYGQMITALSGGVDSIFLTAFAYRLWQDDRIAALTASGPHFAPDEISYAREFCEKVGISHKIIDVTDILPLIKENPEDRCYHCKKAIFTRLCERSQMVGSVLADGTNADDMKDYRPGYQAICELNVASPLKEAGLTKQEIRQALKEMADEDSFIKSALSFTAHDGKTMYIWEKPAFACLASRIPYNEEITAEKLNAVYAAEKYLRSLGLSQVRVRHHGAVARIEVEPADRVRFYDEAFMDKVNDAITECGFEFAALDLAGYKMGNLNGAKKPADTGNNPAYSSDLHAEKYDFKALTDIIARLRAPGGCPWDIKQTHESLKECLIEESGEVIDAINNKDDDNLCEELGDLLLQAVMHAQIAAEEDRFTIDDVIQGVSEKMIRRHPHVFGDKKASSPEESLALWEEIKRQEKKS